MNWGARKARWSRQLSPMRCPITPWISGLPGACPTTVAATAPSFATTMTPWRSSRAKTTPTASSGSFRCDWESSGCASTPPKRPLAPLVNATRGEPSAQRARGNTRLSRLHALMGPESNGQSAPETPDRKETLAACPQGRQEMATQGPRYVCKFPDLWQTLARKIRGHFHYVGVGDKARVNIGRILSTRPGTQSSCCAAA
jgi:hypothetical protein